MNENMFSESLSAIAPVLTAVNETLAPSLETLAQLTEHISSVPEIPTPDFTISEVSNIALSAGNSRFALRKFGELLAFPLTFQLYHAITHL